MLKHRSKDWRMHSMTKIDINITRRVDRIQLTPAILATVTVLGMIAAVVMCLLVFLEVI